MPRRQPSVSSTSVFRRIVGTAVIAGLIAGLALSIGRQNLVVPIILAAEGYERAGHEHGATGQSGAAQATRAEKEWEPAEGIERNAWTWAANGLTGIGFGLLLVAAYVLSGQRMTLQRGVIWGMAGFAVFHLAPAIGLPPALPGSPEVALIPRQLWWLSAVVGTAGGLALLVFASGRWWRWLGIPLLVLPQLIPAPQSDEALIPPLATLTRSFIASTLSVNLAFWLALGAVSGWLWARWEQQEQLIA